MENNKEIMLVYWFLVIIKVGVGPKLWVFIGSGTKMIYCVRIHVMDSVYF